MMHIGACGLVPHEPGAFSRIGSPSFMSSSPDPDTLFSCARVTANIHSDLLQGGVWAGFQWYQAGVPRSSAL
jgi:hypothetical protein